MKKTMLWLCARTIGLLAAAWLTTTGQATPIDACYKKCTVGPCSYDPQAGQVTCSATCITGGPGMINCTASGGTSPSCSLSGSSCTQ